MARWALQFIVDSLRMKLPRQNGPMTSLLVKKRLRSNTYRVVFPFESLQSKEVAQWRHLLSEPCLQYCPETSPRLSLSFSQPLQVVLVVQPWDCWHRWIFFPYPWKHLLTLVFLIAAILTDMKWSFWFWFAFSWWLVILSFFSCICWLFIWLLWKNVYAGPLSVQSLSRVQFFAIPWTTARQASLSITNSWSPFVIGFILLLSFMSPFYILDVNSLSDIQFEDISLIL